MLVLSRKANESIVIGDAITVTVVQIGRGRVRIGIEAPNRVPIYRVEVLGRNRGPAEMVGAACDQADSSAAAEPTASGRSAISRRISPAI
jgi:carbon storage regulator